jgi:hypothetical protein
MGIERLAAMFGGCGSYSPRVGLSGGDSLTRAEIAGLMAGLGDVERDYVYAVFGDEKAEQRLAAFVRRWVRARAEFCRWKDAPPERLDNVAVLVVIELVRPRVCPKCEGTGLVKRIVLGHPWDMKPCASASCDGGVVRLSGRQIADAIGIDESNYRRVWKVRYCEAYGVVNSIATEVNWVVNRAQRGDSVLVA